jgi:hypothetical protein
MDIRRISKKLPTIMYIIPSVQDARASVAKFVDHADAAHWEHRDDVSNLYVGLALNCLSVIVHKSQRLSEINTAHTIAEHLINQETELARKYLNLHDYDTGIRSRPGWIAHGKDTLSLSKLNGEGPIHVY